MNLLEHYIKKIYSEKDITSEYKKQIKEDPKERVVAVDVAYNCYGHTKRETLIFFQNTWEEAKRKGYFLA